MLTTEQIAQYQRDGFLVVPQVVRGGELADLQRVTDRVQEEAIAYGAQLDAEKELQLTEDHGFTDWGEFNEHQFLFAKDQAGRRVFRRAEGMWQRDVVYRAVTAHPELLAVVAALGGDERIPANASLVAKMPRAGAAVPWHRDPTGEYLVDSVGDATPDFTCDIYLDSSTVDNGCLWAIPGSHRHRAADPEDPLDFAVPGIQPLEADAGDVLIHSTGVLHGSPMNSSDSQRRTFYLHYATADALAGFWWNRPSEWIDEMREFAAQCRSERNTLMAAG